MKPTIADIYPIFIAENVVGGLSLWVCSSLSDPDAQLKRDTD
jgi:hypothetical protein